MDERERFIATVDSGEYTVKEACGLFGISRETGHKWLRRHAAEGSGGLVDRSRAPHSCPHRTAAAIEEEIVWAAASHRDWGPRLLRTWWLRRHREAGWPAASTIGEILKRHGLQRAPRRRAKVAPHPGRPEVSSAGPNELWTADYKGEFRTRNRRWCYPLTVADQCSRFLLGCRALPSTGVEGARPAMAQVFEEYGLPRAILTDNGPPFGSTGLARLSRLSVWWTRLGIVPILIEPGHPEQNGRHERMHRTLKLRTREPAESCRGQQRLFDRFRREYNEERPHQGLAGRAPAEVYTPSRRPYPRRLPALEYPPGWEARKVCGNGCLVWHNEFVFLSRVLIGEQLGLQESDDGVWSVYFGPSLLGQLDEATRSFHAVPAPEPRRGGGGGGPLGAPAHLGGRGADLRQLSAMYPA